MIKISYTSKKEYILLLWLLLLVSLSTLNAQIYHHNFGTTGISAHPYTVAPTTLANHLSGSSWTNSVNSWTSTAGATGQAIRLTSSTPTTITLTFNVANNYQVDITSFNFWRQRSNFGLQDWSMTINGINVGSGTVGATGESIGVTNVSNPIVGLSGTVTVVIALSNPTGNGTFRLDDFTLYGSVTSSCLSPIVTSFSPTTGPENTLVTINGSGFSNGSGTSSVKFNGIEATSFTVVSNTVIKAYVPAGSNSSGTITIVTDGCEGFSSGSFTPIKTVPAVNYSTDIYISEVYDANGGDRGIIELYNGTASPVNLSNYTIRRYGNIGDSTFTTFNLSGTIPPASTFLIHFGNNGTHPTPCGFGDSVTIVGIGFNADDEFELVKNGSTVIDNVHAPSNIGYSMKRKTNAVAPKVTFNGNDWTTQTNPTNCTTNCHCSDLGMHNIITPTLPTMTSPVSKTACENSPVVFSTTLSNSTGFTYQWKVVGPSGVWTNVVNGGSYSGATTNTLTINPSTLALDENQYYCQITSNTAGVLVSNAAQLAVTPVNTVPTFTQVTAICSGGTLSALPTTSNNGITGTWSPALNNTATTLYTFTPTTGQCATTTTMTINVNTATTPAFTQVTAICSGGTLSALPLTSNNGITGTWSPALDNTATTVYTFTPSVGQCATTATMTINVNTSTTPTFTQVTAICSGETLPALPLTSNNGITGTWSPALDNTATTTYTFTPTAGHCATTTTMTINVNMATTSAFTQVTAICPGGTLSALPLTSNNGITGTWAPALDNTATTTYTFTPTAGQCATTTTMTINVNTATVPTFTQVTAICSGETLSALPLTSNNGITGTWSPAIDNTATTTYTFTPTAGQCATAVTMTINVNTATVPIFTQVAAICQGEALSALPLTSNNGITGTWSPAIDNTATTTYTFTPTAGQCANTATMTINVNTSTVPTFTQVTAICQGAVLSPLPLTSNNGITGTWSPAVDNTATTTYTFTPTAGQCATAVTMTINVNTATVPTFTQVTAICSGGTLSALPLTSNNGITGTWSPALDNTATTTYTFTPSAGQCATTTTMTINVNTATTPAFTQVTAICSGGTLPALPLTSNNGITGTWSPAMDNTATTVYTFTPMAGQCATTATMTINVNTASTPTFTQVTAICSGGTLSALPTTSNNGITGTWAPAIDNTATTTYTFTPSAGQCATTTTMTINVNTATAPTFTQVTAICSGETLSALPLTSNNGITGAWSPALDNTATTVYTFTPSAGQCATTTTMTINVNISTTPTFTQVTAICSGETLSALPLTSNNGITGTWSPALDNTATTTYTFTPSVGQCATTTTMTINVNTATVPTFTQVTAICSGETLSALPLTSNNGITGTWTPTLDNTATTTYTFTPSAGQCATTTTMTINVNTSTTPTFTQVTAICSGETLSALPLTSNNGITGTWSPALDNNTTTTYTFTPSVGQCATTTTMTINVNTATVPTFTQVTAICSGGTLSALPTTSNNGITGTWSPALDNTATTVYTFTPSAGQCATTATMTINVNTPTVPTFTAVTPICQGGTLSALPLVSNNGITGTWSPVINNTATTTYTFTPATGQCATTATMTINVNTPTAPTFTAMAPICFGETLSALPLVSNNSITGTWSPVLDNTATTLYTFTPTAGQCARATQMIITVNPLPRPVLKDDFLCLDNDNGSVLLPKSLNCGLPNANHSFTWTLDNNPLPTTTNTHLAFVPGTYRVTATNLLTGCSSTATSVMETSSLAIATASVEQDFNKNQIITINVTGGSGVYEFILDGGIPQDSNQFSNIHQGEYEITVRDKNGCGELELVVFALNYPRFFTPNGDGYNDTWTIEGLSAQQDAKIYIFDRYGKLIKAIRPYQNNSWDGTLNGRELPSTDYWFTLFYQDKQGQNKEFKAHFSLKR